MLDAEDGGGCRGGGSGGDVDGGETDRDRDADWEAEVCVRGVRPAERNPLNHPPYLPGSTNADVPVFR